MNKVKRYIEAYHTCLKTKPKYKKNKPVYGRIPVDYAPVQDLSIDIKHMPMAFDGYQYLFCISSKSEESPLLGLFISLMMS